jgi:patatin-like phospholipase/acyl hydrolase
VLKETFGCQNLGQSSSRLLIPAFVGPKAQVAVFKTDHHPDYRRDWKSPAWEVARATSAAPTFFEGHRFNFDFFLDGGVWANNPILLAIVEALSSYDLQLDQVRVLSVGTGNLPPRLKQSTVRAGLIGWRDIISVAMYLSTDTALSQARLLLGHHNVIRVEPSISSAAIELDDWTNARDRLPQDALEQLGPKLSEVMPFLRERVATRERHYTSFGGDVD